MKRFFTPALALTLLLALTACGGGGSGGGTTDSGTTPTTGTTPPTTTPPTTTPPTSQPQIAGFDFALQSGDFWEYRWDNYDYSWAQGSTASTVQLSGRFRVTLGTPSLMGGYTAYPLTVTGSTGPSSTTSYTPRWQYLAMDSNQMLGSVNGASFTPIFDAQNGFWPGGGFFTDLGSSGLNQATQGNIATPSYATAYISGTAYKTGLSASQSTCQYYPGVGNICGDSAYNFNSWEYYKAGIGPYGHYYYNSYSYSGGGFSSGGVEETMVGLVASSLQGDTVDYILENEPNDAPTAPQTLSQNQAVLGLAYPFAAGWDVSGLGILGAPDIYGWSLIEDVYKFTLPLSTQPRTVTISLDFSGATDPVTDYDIYLINSAGTTTLASSTGDNAASGVYTEEISTLLFSGPYLIGVDAYNNPGQAEYTLRVSW